MQTRRHPVIATAIACLASMTSVAGVVTLELASPQDGAIVSPGGSIHWSIHAYADPLDGLGLALVVTNLVGAPENPAAITLTPATIPVRMERFSRPLGISNPGLDGAGSGYGGTPVPIEGGMDLIEIGGAQNTFGVVGRGIGTATDVQTGIGQSDGGQLVAEGHFAAPTTFGSYCVMLTAGVANTLDGPLVRGTGWTVDGATVVYAQQAISFVVGVPGDVNGDGVVGGGDLGLLLSAWGGCAGCPADINGDGMVDGADLGLLLGAWGSGARAVASASDRRVAAPPGTGGPDDGPSIDRSALRHRPPIIDTLSVQLGHHGDGPRRQPGAVGLAGALVVSLEEGFELEAPNRIVVLVADRIIGRFDEERLPTVSPNLSLDVVYEVDRVVLVVSSATSSDVDGDGVVDLADIMLILKHWGSSGSGDINVDGVVDGLDLALVIREVGRTADSGE